MLPVDPLRVKSSPKIQLVKFPVTEPVEVSSTNPFIKLVLTA